MAKHDLVAQKIATIQERLAAADRIFGRKLEDFMGDELQRDAACFYLFLAIQECIDIALHWVADSDWGTPEDIGSAFEILRRKGLISGELSHGFQGMVGLRNRIAHGYASLDPHRIWAEYSEGRRLLDAFVAVAAGEIGL